MEIFKLIQVPKLSSEREKKRENRLGHGNDRND